MTEVNPQWDAPIGNDSIPLLNLANLLLRRRRFIVAMGVIGALFGLMYGRMARRQFTSTATFVPQGNEGGESGLAAAASQFGFRMPSGGSAV